MLLLPHDAWRIHASVKAIGYPLYAELRLNKLCVQPCSGGYKAPEPCAGVVEYDEVLPCVERRCFGKGIECLCEAGRCTPFDRPSWFLRQELIWTDCDPE